MADDDFQIPSLDDLERKEAAARRASAEKPSLLQRILHPLSFRSGVGQGQRRSQATYAGEASGAQPAAPEVVPEQRAPVVKRIASEAPEPAPDTLEGAQVQIRARVSYRPGVKKDNQPLPHPSEGASGHSDPPPIRGCQDTSCRFRSSMGGCNTYDGMCARP